MISDEEKKRIIEKIKFEQEIKESLIEQPKSSRYAWLNSKLFLLLLGSLITGILVPIFQYTQKTIEWKRENQYSNITYSMNMMRESLREFTNLQGFNSETYEILKSIINNNQISDDNYSEFTRRHTELQNRRFKQNAKVSSSLLYFSDSAELNRLFENHLRESVIFASNVEKYARHKYCLREHDVCPGETHSEEALKAIETDLATDRINRLNNSFNDVLDKMTNEIKIMENESESFRL